MTAQGTKKGGQRSRPKNKNRHSKGKEIIMEIEGKVKNTLAVESELRRENDELRKQVAELLYEREITEEAMKATTNAVSYLLEEIEQLEKERTKAAKERTQAAREAA